MGIVFHHRDIMSVGDSHNSIHLTADARVMHWKDGFGAGRNGRFQFGLIQIKGIRPDVQKDRTGTTQDESIDRRDEGEIRNDDLVPILNFQ